MLGPHLIPVVAEPDLAVARPELAVLSVMAHGRRLPPDEAALMAIAAVNAAAANRDDDLAKLYYDLIDSSLSDAARKAFEAMNLKNYEYKSEFARKYVAEGRQEGKAEGRQQGKAEGRQQGKAEAVLQVLAARGIDVPEAIRQRVLACTDPAVLDGWIRRAAVATTAAEVAGGDS